MVAKKAGLTLFGKVRGGDAARNAALRRFGGKCVGRTSAALTKLAIPYCSSEDGSCAVCRHSVLNSAAQMMTVVLGVAVFHQPLAGRVTCSMEVRRISESPRVRGLKCLAKMNTV